MRIREERNVRVLQNERGNVKKLRMNCLVILREDPVLRGRVKSNPYLRGITASDSDEEGFTSVTEQIRIVCG